MDDVFLNSVKDGYDRVRGSIVPWSFNSWSEYDEWLDKGLDLGLIEYVIIRKQLFKINDRGMAVNAKIHATGEELICAR